MFGGQALLLPWYAVVPSGTFLASAFLIGVCAGQVPFWWLLGVLPEWVSGQGPGKVVFDGASHDDTPVVM